MFGAGAIFLYVGAEVSVGSNLINFLHQSDVLDVTQERAGKLVSLYWLGAMVGRFAGSALLARFRAVRLLSINAFVAAVLCLAVSQGAGVFAAGCALAIGLFNSIMFPEYLHAHLGAQHGFGRCDFGVAVHGHCRRRGIAAGDGLHCGFHNGLGGAARGVSAADGGLRLDLRFRGTAAARAARVARSGKPGHCG